MPWRNPRHGCFLSRFLASSYMAFFYEKNIYEKNIYEKNLFMRKPVCDKSLFLRYFCL